MRAPVNAVNPRWDAPLSVLLPLLVVGVGCGGSGRSIPRGDEAPRTHETSPEASIQRDLSVSIAGKRKPLPNGLLPGMMPRHSASSTPPERGVDHSATPQCRNPAISYFDGPIIQSPVIVPVFWNSLVNATVVQNMPQFFADVTVSSYWPWLQEYDTVGISGGTEQAILSGTATDGVTLTPSRCPAATTGSCTVSDTEVQNELNAQISAGVLPAPLLDCTGNVETIYMVSFPPNITITGPEGTGNSCANDNGYCAYHNTGVYGTNTPLIYGVLTDEITGPCKSGCGGNATALENTTSTASHELVEAITDPDIGFDTQNGYASPAAWADNNNDCGEVADICDDDGVDDTITVSGRTWSVQEIWSNKQGKCTSTGDAGTICAGSDSDAGCRRCSCGDNGQACSGDTSICETNSDNALFGRCEQCSASDNDCAEDQICEQSSDRTSDDICVTSSDAGSASDAGITSSDAGSSTMDAGTLRSDAGSTASDAGSSAADAGTTGLDAGETKADAGVSVSDAGTAVVDAGFFAPDAGTTRPDAGPSISDAGAPVADAGFFTPDAGTYRPDAGPSASDAGSDVADAGFSTHDAGTDRVDAGESVSDAGLPTMDAGSAAEDAGSSTTADAGELPPMTDAGTPSVDAGAMPASQPRGCGCSNGGDSIAMLGFLAMLLIRRRRVSSPI